MELHNILELAQRLRGRYTEVSSRYPTILGELEEDYFRRFGDQYIENTDSSIGWGAFLFIALTKCRIILFISA
ncbi:MAG: hypothetical protein U5O39_04540 [Gammaproteobacteria bacterium]|nr:hypothetical protein [Gammaproteobacteria bacterium]